MTCRVLVTITGTVQGVNFRHQTRQQALQHNVTGWVKNRPDGAVQGCFEGEELDVNAVVAWCRNGPAWARVDQVVTELATYTGEWDGFIILP